MTKMTLMTLFSRKYSWKANQLPPQSQIVSTGKSSLSFCHGHQIKNVIVSPLFVIFLSCLIRVGKSEQINITTTNTRVTSILTHQANDKNDANDAFFKKVFLESKPTATPIPNSFHRQIVIVILSWSPPRKKILRVKAIDII